MPDVLICDPDREHAETWTRPIAASGYSLELVESSSRAVQRLLSEPCGMLLVSVSPGDDDGLDTISVVHNIDSNLPVVAVAKGESLDLQREVRSRKVFYYLVQPVDSEELEAVVGRALAARSDGS
jgi:DNA-binding NtrC family response regulator